MIWTRRAFLQTCLAAAGALAVVELPALGTAPTVVVAPAEPIWLLELMAFGKAKGMVHLVRADGQDVMHFWVGPGSIFRWVSAPGEEIAMAGLKNASDLDLDITLVLQQGRRRWCVLSDGNTEELGFVREPVIIGPPRGSFAEYLRRERIFMDTLKG